MGSRRISDLCAGAIMGTGTLLVMLLWSLYRRDCSSGSNGDVREPNSFRGVADSGIF